MQSSVSADVNVCAPSHSIAPVQRERPNIHVVFVLGREAVTDMCGGVVVGCGLGGCGWWVVAFLRQSFKVLRFFITG